MRFLPANPAAALCRFLPWGGVLAILWAGLWSAQSYVSAQDPSTIYLPLARRIADTNFSLEAIREAARWMAPGWPVLLALVIKAGGPFAPAWIQLPFALLALIALWRIVLRHAASAATAWLAVGLTLLAWLAGPEPTFACLLYPFRELPAFACALWAVERAGQGGRRSTALLAGFFLLGVAALRETFLPCAIAGAVAAAWLQGADRRERLLRSALLLAAPVAAGVFAAVLLSGDVNRQILNVWGNLSAGMLPAPVPEAAAGLVAQMAGQVTWAGLFLPLLAPAHPASRRPGILILIMTAALLAVHVLLPSHFRYGLACSLLLPAGVAIALHPVLHRLSAQGWRWLGGAAGAALLALALSQHPWGAAVRRADVTETLRRIAASLPTGRPYYAERRSRTLVSCIKGYSSAWPQGDPALPAAGALYFDVVEEPVREDRHDGPMHQDPVDVQLRRRGMALVPLGDRNGNHVPLKIAGFAFELQRVTPNQPASSP